MAKFATYFLLIVSFLVCPGDVGKQVQATPPQPTAEHKKLGYFVGRWNSEVQMKNSAAGRVGTYTATEECKWFTGNFSVVCHSQANTPTGNVAAISIMGYDPVERAYIYFETDSEDETVCARGTVIDNTWTWTWTKEDKTSGGLTRIRLTQKPVSEDSFTIKAEMASAYTPFSVVAEGKETRLK